MHLDDYTRQVGEHVSAAAALGDERTREVAAALTTAVAPAVRLALMSALAAAADEVTAALLDSPGSPAVTVRLDGDDIRVEVLTASAEEPESRVDDGEATARISLRLSDALKAQIDVAAAQDGISVNTWLVRAATNALRPSRGGSPGNRGSGNSHRVSGWING
jgi:hypothetical protein